MQPDNLCCNYILDVTGLRCFLLKGMQTALLYAPATRESDCSLALLVDKDASPQMIPLVSKNQLVHCLGDNFYLHCKVQEHRYQFFHYHNTWICNILSVESHLRTKPKKGFFFKKKKKHTLFYWYYILWTFCSATAIGQI